MVLLALVAVWTGDGFNPGRGPRRREARKGDTDLPPPERSKRGMGRGKPTSNVSANSTVFVLIEESPRRKSERFGSSRLRRRLPVVRFQFAKLLDTLDAPHQ